MTEERKLVLRLNSIEEEIAKLNSFCSILKFETVEFEVSKWILPRVKVEITTTKSWLFWKWWNTDIKHIAIPKQLHEILLSACDTEIKKLEKEFEQLRKS